MGADQIVASQAFRSMSRLLGTTADPQNSAEDFVILELEWIPQNSAEIPCIEKYRLTRK
jgi:hypothetical protein